MKSSILSILAAASSVSAVAPDLLPGKWGSDLNERYFTQSGKHLTGLKTSYVGGIDDPTSIYTDVSWSPWTGIGEPPADYVLAQGITIMWWGTGPEDHMGFHWRRTADNQTTSTDFLTENILVDSWPVSYFWGVLQEGDRRYKRVGGCNYGVENRTSKVQNVTVDVEWWENKYFKDHWTSHKFAVQPTRIGYALPRPRVGLYGWIADNLESVEASQ